MTNTQEARWYLDLPQELKDFIDNETEPEELEDMTELVLVSSKDEEEDVSENIQ